MKELLNGLRQAAQMTTQGQAQTRLATVTSFDPNTYSAKVLLQPEGQETGWLPVTSPWTGNGWGLFCPPTPGDLVHVEFQEGGIEAGLIVGRFFNDIERPLATPSGELWIVHKSGSLLKFHNDGSVELTAAQNLTAVVAGNASVAVTGSITSNAAVWNHTGPVNITGNVRITGTELVTGTITGQGGMALTGSAGGGGSAATITGNVTVTSGNVTADGIGLKTHTHADAQGGTVGLPQ